MGEGEGMTECTKKWKILRDHFVRELRKKKRKKKTGTAGPEYTSNWPLYTMLTFLTDTVKHKS